MERAQAANAPSHNQLKTGLYIKILTTLISPSNPNNKTRGSNEN
jgi:hypothetical protein